MEWSLVVSIAFAVTQTVIAIVQTVRLRTLRRVRNTHLNLIWRNTKRLSHDLLIETEEKVPRKACGVRAQRIEEIVATLIVNLFHVKTKTIREWRAAGVIDEFDYDLLKQLTK